MKELEVLVLDEADRLLDMGFETTITNVLKRLPKQRRTGLFSATQTKELKSLIRAGLRNPISIDVKVTFKPRSGTSLAREQHAQQQTATPNSLRNFYTVTRPEQKLNALIHFLAKLSDAYFKKSKALTSSSSKNAPRVAAKAVDVKVSQLVDYF